MLIKIKPSLPALLLLSVLLWQCSTKETTTTVGNEVLQLYPIKENSKWGYMNTTGKIVVPATFDYAWDFSDGLGRFKNKGKYGFVNAEGKIVIHPSLTYADDFKGEYTRVNIKDTAVSDVFFDGYNLFSGWTFMNKKGVVFSRTFAIADPVKGIHAAVKDVNNYEIAYSYVSFVNGELIRKGRITEAIFNFNGHDLAPALDATSGKLGLIDNQEQWVVLPSFDDIAPFSEGLAAAKKDNLYGYIDTEGNWIYQYVAPVDKLAVYNLSYDFKPFTNGLAAVKLGPDVYGYITKDGKPAFRQHFKSVSSFNTEGYAIVSTEKGTGLIDTQGNFIIKPHLDIQSVEYGIAIYRDKEGYGAKDIKTLKDIITPTHTEISITGNLIRIREAGASVGYINNDGEFVIMPQFNSGWDFKNGKAMVNFKDKMVYVDKTGNVAGDVPAEEFPYYDRSASSIYAWNNETGKFGYGKTGVEGLVIPAAFDFATDFEGNIARINIGATLSEDMYAYSGGKWGLIDTTGKTIIPPIYDLISSFKNDIALFNKGGDASYTLCETECDEFVYYNCAGGKWGLLNTAGKELIEAKYSKIIPFGENYLIKEGEYFGLMDAQGTMIYPAKLQLDQETEDGSIEMMYNEKYIKIGEGTKVGIMDTKGNWILKPKYDDVLFDETSDSPFTEGVVLIRSGELWGAADASGNLTIPALYEEIRQFSNGLAAVKKNDKWGFINKANKFIIEPKYFNVRDYQGEVTIVQEEETGFESVINHKDVTVFKTDSSVSIDTDGFKEGLCIIRNTVTTEEAGGFKTSCGVIDSKGNIVFNKNALSEVRIQQKGLLYVIKNNKWAMANYKGVMLTGFDYDWIEPYDGQELLRCNIGGEAVYDEMLGTEDFYGGLWGLVDRTGQLRVPPKFAEIGKFSEGLAFARSGEDMDLIGYTDLRGNVIWPMKK